MRPWKEMIGERLYWREISNRYDFLRSGVLTSVYRGRLEFNESHDYRSPSEFRYLTDKKHEEWV
jgi:hypothetical protein